MNVIDVDRFRITYERAGLGPPLVLVHGGVGDRRTWSAQMEALADAFTVVAWDMPGFGGSTDPPETFTLGDFADCLAGFIRALGLERPHVAGLSFGGGLALELYRRHPSIPRTLVLVSAYAGWAGSLPSDEVEYRVRLAVKLSELSPPELVETLGPTMFSESVPPEVAKPFFDSMAEFHPIGIRASARAFGAADLRDVLPTIAVPTLLVYGDRDVRSPLNVAEEMRAKIPNSKLVVVPRAGHVLNIEAADRFNAEVREFVRAN